MKDFWNERYAEKSFIYGKAPNEFFKQEIDQLAPGTLLLPCEGEGRNAVYAAAKKWKVDAFDQSEAGKEKCLKLAAENNTIINYQVADALAFDYGENKYDAIALIYAHFPVEIRKQVHDKCIKALKPGGTLLLEAFTPLQLQHTSGGPKNEEMLYTGTMLTDDFRELHITTINNVKIYLNEGPYHQGEADIVRLIATK